MNRFQLLLGSIFLIASTAAQAEEGWHINLHTVSSHFNQREHGKEWNERNWGLGIRREFSDQFSAQAGFYRNSLDKWSTYAIGEYTPLVLGSVSAGAYAGIRTNYSKPVQLAGGALARWQGQRLSVTTRITPKSCGSCSGFIAVEFGWKFG